MNRNRLLVVILVFMMASESSNAYLLLNFRKLPVAAPKKNSFVKKVSPLPIPVYADSKETGKHSPTTNSSDVVLGGSNDNTAMVSVGPPPDKRVEGKQKDREEKQKKKGDSTLHSRMNTNGSCEGSLKKCWDQKAMLACIKNSESGSTVLILLIQNKEEHNLRVDLRVLASMEEEAFPAFEIPINRTMQIDIPPTMAKNSTIVLDAGNGHCVLPLKESSNLVGNLLNQLSFYSRQATPVHGAYVMLLVTFTFGSTCACCKLRKRRHGREVPYQELEMGLPGSASAVIPDTAESWDQGWEEDDDDWDDQKDVAVKSPGERNIGNISANGLTSRSSKRDGWENDWEV